MTRQLLTGCISAGAASGGGGGIPDSIIAGDNLAHWWKLTDGATSTSSATDFGVSASSTDMTLTGASNVSSDGPKNGSPDVIEFNGSTGLGEVKARDGGSNTPLGTLFASDNFTVTWWMKDATASYSNWATWIACLGE